VICNHLHTRWIFPFPKLKFFLNKNSHSFFFPFKKEKFCVFHKPEERNWFKLNWRNDQNLKWEKEGRKSCQSQNEIWKIFILFLCGWCWSGWFFSFNFLNFLSLQLSFFLSSITLPQWKHCPRPLYVLAVPTSCCPCFRWYSVNLSATSPAFAGLANTTSPTFKSTPSGTKKGVCTAREKRNQTSTHEQ